MRTLKLFLLVIGAALIAVSSDAECVKVSQAQCEGLKSSLAEYTSSLQSKVGDCIQYADYVSSLADSFEPTYIGFVNFIDYNNLWDASGYPGDPTAWDLYFQMQDYNENIGYYTDVLANQLDDLASTISNLAPQVDDINCEVCSDGSDDDDNPGGGGCGSGDCPCAAYIQSLQIILDHIDADLHEIKQRLQSWEKYIKMLEEILDKTESIDDFMQDELKEAMKNFFKSFFNVTDYKDTPKVEWWKLYTEEMARSWFYSDYTNASAFVQQNAGSYDFLEKGKLIFNSPQHPNNFDVSEYKSFNWFQRVEFLLADLVGVFSPTNSIVADLTEAQKEEAEDQEQVVEDAFGEGAFTDSQSVVAGLLDRIESLQGKLNPFHGLFSSSYSAQPIELLPETSVSSVLVSNTSPGFYLETDDYGGSGVGIHDIAVVAHNLTSFVYLVFFLVVDIFAFLFFVRGLMAIIQWYHKIVLSWFKTFNVR